MDITVTHDLYGDFDDDEAVARFPEVTDITDSHLREQVIQVIQDDIPNYFWVAPASSRNHQPEHRSRHGLWLHIKRVCSMFEGFAPSLKKQGHMSQQDVNEMRAACILHDMFKYGRPPTAVDSTVSNHDILAANYIRNHTSLPDGVADAVEAHNGCWYVGSPPSTSAEQTMHMADLAGSRPYNDIAVKDMHPVLKTHFPAVGER